MREEGNEKMLQKSPGSEYRAKRFLQRCSKGEKGVPGRTMRSVLECYSEDSSPSLRTTSRESRCAVSGAPDSCDIPFSSVSQCLQRSGW